MGGRSMSEGEGFIYDDITLWPNSVPGTRFEIDEVFYYGGWDVLEENKVNLNAADHGVSVDPVTGVLVQEEGNTLPKTYVDFTPDTGGIKLCRISIDIRVYYNNDENYIEQTCGFAMTNN